METNLVPTPASEWKGAQEFAGHDLELPSGNVARVKRIPPAAFLQGGLIPDPLTEIIRKAIHTKRGLNPADLDKIADDPEKLASALETIDRVLCKVMVMPTVMMPPACDVAVDDGYCGEYANTSVHQTPTRSGHHEYREGPRDPSVLYADVVDLQDKMFIFQWSVGGTGELESFRQELQGSVESLQNGQDVQPKAKRSTRSR